jgi:hypothetical protein
MILLRIHFFCLAATLPMKRELDAPKLLALLKPLLVLLLGGSGCNDTRDETWQCFDTSGRPVGGVLFVQNYGLPSSRPMAHF